MTRSTIFQFYHGGQFKYLRTQDYPEKSTDLPRVTEKFITCGCIKYTSTLVQIKLINFSGCRHQLHSTTIIPSWACMWNPFFSDRPITKLSWKWRPFHKMADPDQLPSPHGHGGLSLVISSRSTTKTSCTWRFLH